MANHRIVAVMVSVLVVISFTTFLLVGADKQTCASKTIDVPTLEGFWNSIDNQLKTGLTLYQRDGQKAFRIEVVIANSKTLGELQYGLARFLLGKLGASDNGNTAGKLAMLLYVYQPLTAQGGWFDYQHLRLVIPETNEKITFSQAEVLGPITDEKGHPFNNSRKKITTQPLTGVLILSSQETELLREAKQDSDNVYLHYADCITCSRRVLFDLSGL